CGREGRFDYGFDYW
nr:immunoglobulin heavy chain junction region [Mus musculus]